MKIKIIALIFFTACFIVNNAFSLDWKSLHEQAENADQDSVKIKVEKDSNNLSNLYELGLVYLNLYDHKQAKKIFEQMLAVDPDLIEAKWGIAECLRREYRIDLSQKMLEEIVAIQPDFFPAFISLSYIKFNLKEYDQAAKLSDSIIRRGKKKADRHTLTRAYLIFAGSKGMIAHNGGLLSAFINGSSVFTNIKRARTLMPDSAEVYYGLGCFYFLAPGAYGGNIDKAKEYLEKTIELDPQIIDAYVRLAQVYKFNGDMDKFDYYLNLALNKEPQNFLANDIKSNTCNFICLDRPPEF
ncbi:MAG: tetratricopeptide repeat protein [Candidatus Omnitrophica bacterium]|nr:tetratricopeptide repeat protein [Candidatus Omnitrophota bacterium]